MELLGALPDGWKGIGAMLGVIAAGAIYLRQYMSGAAAARASDTGQIEALGVYKELNADLRAALVEANTRADHFAAERNAAVVAMGKLEGQLAEMVRRLEEQAAELAALRKQVTELTEQLNAKK